MAAAAPSGSQNARMPATEIEAYEDDTRLHYDVESDFPRFLDSVLQRTDQISQTKVDEEIVEQHNVTVDQTVRLLRVPRYTGDKSFKTGKSVCRQNQN